MLLRVGYRITLNFREATAPAGRVTLEDDATVTDSGLPDPQSWDAPQHLVQDLTDDVLVYLLASRYCEVDSELKDIAGGMFGGTQPGWPRVAAICDFVHRHVRYWTRDCMCGVRAMDQAGWW